MTKIEIWNNREIRDYLSTKKFQVYTPQGRRDKLFVGFKFFGPDFFYKRPDGDCRGSSMGWGDVSIEDYPEDRSVVALKDKDIVSIASFMYCKGEYDFWHYYIRFMETREDYQNQGIATELVRRLKEPCFLHGQVLMVRDTSYTAEGRKYLKRVLDRELVGCPFKFVDRSFTNLKMYDAYQSSKEELPQTS